MFLVSSLLGRSPLSSRGRGARGLACLTLGLHFRSLSIAEPTSERADGLGFGPRPRPQQLIKITIK